MTRPTVTKVLSTMPRRTSGGFFIVRVEVKHNGRTFNTEAWCPSMAYALSVEAGYKFKDGTF